MAGTGCLGLGEVKARWCMADTQCCVCRSRDDTIPHLFITCPGLTDNRLTHFKQLEKGLNKIDMSHVWQSFMASSVNKTLSFLLGVYGNSYGNEVGDLFDITCKQFLAEAWQYRRDLVGNPPA